jgi:hypothetical protein
MGTFVSHNKKYARTGKHTPKIVNAADPKTKEQEQIVQNTLGYQLSTTHSGQNIAIFQQDSGPKHVLEPTCLSVDDILYEWSQFISTFGSAECRDPFREDWEFSNLCFWSEIKY